MESDLDGGKLGHVAHQSLAGWLITFGDLLTLLVCFFLSMIGMGALTFNRGSPPKPVTSRNDVAPPKLDEANSVTARPGTPFAQYDSDEGRVLVALSEAEFSNATAELETSAIERLKQAVTAQEFPAGRMLVEVCAAVPDKNEAELWDVSIARTLTLRRQLVDVGAAGQLLSLRSVGGDCGLLQMQGTAQDISARIVVQDKDSIHG